MRKYLEYMAWLLVAFLPSMLIIYNYTLLGIAGQALLVLWWVALLLIYLAREE